MSLSKNVKHYRRCVHYSLVNKNTASYQTTQGTNAVENKMPSRLMSLTHWKILTMLKEYVAKLSNDKSFRMVINNELMKILPRIYNTSVRDYDSTTVQGSELAKSNSQDKKSETTISNVISGLKLGVGKDEQEMASVKTEIIPKWQLEVSTAASKASILSRTQHIINSIMFTENEEGKFEHIETLSSHIQQFPEAKNYAIKEGAIRLLLHLRKKTKKHQHLGVLNEVFALLGYVEPLPNKGIRILSIDGGGVRGILVILMLKKLEELTGKRIYEMFDYICGVSTGAILACTLGVLQKTCHQLHQDYINISTQIFTQSALRGTSSLVWTHSYYDTNLWEKLLKEQMREFTLIGSTRILNCPKISAISAVVNHERVSAYVFRNYSFPCRVQSQYMGGSNYKLWEAARASAAAPTYFEECKLGNLLHQDGGILVNNPTAVAIHEAKLLWPNSPIQCVVSFGTGRTVPNPLELNNVLQSNVSSWKNKFMKIVDSATDTEGVHTMLTDLLPDNVYFRFNPYLTEMMGMAEIEPKKLEQLERDALMYLRRNEDKFQQAAKALMEPKTYVQKVGDYINQQGELLGIWSKL